MHDHTRTFTIAGRKERKANDVAFDQPDADAHDLKIVDRKYREANDVAYEQPDASAY